MQRAGVLPYHLFRQANQKRAGFDRANLHDREGAGSHQGLHLQEAIQKKQAFDVKKRQKPDNTAREWRGVHRTDQKQKKAWSGGANLASKTIIQDGAKYEGTFKKDEACGFGKFWHISGDLYEGEWSHDKANGFGKYTHKVFYIF